MVDQSEYSVMIDSYRRAINVFRDDALNTERRNSEALKADYDTLLSELSRTRSLISDQAGSIEQGIQLDVNLERQRQADAFKKLERALQEAAEYGEIGVDLVKAEIEVEGAKVKRALLAFLVSAATGIAIFYYGGA